MSEFDIQAHLDAMEGRIREDVREVRVDVKASLTELAALKERVDSHDKQFKWIWGTASSGFLMLLSAFGLHVKSGH